MRLPNSLRLTVQSVVRNARPHRTATSAVVASNQNASCSSHHRGLASSAASRRALASSLSAINSTYDDREERVARIVIFGKPGAGKGTLSSRLVKKYDLLTISTGDLLRQHIAQGTDIGQQAEDIMARGGLVPDELMLKVVTSKLDTLQNRHWLLDGFPRTLKQGQLLEAHLRNQNTPLTLVVNINVPDEIILSRITDRWIHLPSGRVYNTSYNPPRVAGYDDVTGEPLTRRPDDNPEVFSQRLQSFYASTSPLLAYYQALASQNVPQPKNPHQHPHQLSIHRPEKVSVRTITGRTSDEIWPELDYIITTMFPTLKKRNEDMNKKQQDLANAIAANNALAAASFK